MIPKLPKGFTHPMEIGGGAFAHVYRARQRTLDRWVAIKIIHERDRAKRLGLLREARTQAGLRIDCIPRVYDAFEWRGRVCIVMQWVKGVSLSRVLEQELGIEQRAALAGGIVAALAGLHGEGYAHRDLKPANILVSPDDGVYLIDFGFTKHVLDGEKSIAGTVKGTPAYMAPELWSGREDIDHIRADLYSLGKVLGQVQGERLAAEVAGRLLCEDPAARFSSAVELLECWQRRYPPPTSARLWQGIAAEAVAQTLAPRILAAVRQLLYAGREDEAYWMLVECLEENPEMPEALELMSSFPRHARRQVWRRRVPVAAAVIAAACAVGPAFLAGRRTSRQELVVRVAGGRPEREVRLSPALRAEGSLEGADAALLGDTLSVNELTGRVFLTEYPSEGALLIDGEPVGGEAKAGTGIQLAYGEYALAWKSEEGKVVWRERVMLLPFQAKGVRVKPR